MKTIDELPDDKLVFTVRVQPRAAHDKIVGWTESGHLKIRITARPVDDSANRHLIKLLSKFLDVARSHVVIASGSRSRTKRITAPSSCKNRLLSVEDIC